MLDGKTILLTGGTGTFGQFFTQYILLRYNPSKIIIYSRDEYKQFHMARRFRAEFPEHFAKLRFFIGDVRDKVRLSRALEGGVDYVIHAAAMKQVPACEYNPFEAVKNNIHGAQNVIEAALDCGIEKVVALSTDKAVNPVNLYGATKMVSDRLFIAANSYVGSVRATRFAVVRYGNVFGSRGSVLPLFRKLLSEGKKCLPITDTRMTRFWISTEEAVELVLLALEQTDGGETYIAKIPSIKMTDLAEAMSPKSEGGSIELVGIREGEKLHEVMITEDDAPYAYECDRHYVIYPAHNWWSAPRTIQGVKVAEGFCYSSGENDRWLGVPQIRDRLQAITDKTIVEND
ncbi:UDP-N-acetylglucosamine 4,6-dehydratase (inverting) [Candidatus Haliotispira prima]|uniref:UDP-N-acetylglucosamine 4,6-dehydratase (Inverting) n=1 Tax=Candidatus Haliotispira prima TaxID=3034016 RepID=A0ABY8MFU5_9SPIO|nr:UDP-N-acetylglucosamine 4,6-dehydratase (inverting) [Candidatus Haliotispira prima]